VSILSPERTVTRTRPVQIAESVVTALSDHVYRAAASVRCRTPTNVVRNIRDRCTDANVAFHFNFSAPTRHLSVWQLRHEH